MNGNEACVILDQTELVHLAMKASGNGEEGIAIAYLKQAVNRVDASGAAHFLLGAEYAQVKMFDRAIAEMVSAVAVEPTLFIARLELGMLCVATNDLSQALDVLEPLCALGKENPYHWFGTGMVLLIQERKEEGVSCLTKGMILNLHNADLNSSFANLIDQIDVEWAVGVPAPDGVAVATLPRFELGAYFGS